METLVSVAIIAILMGIVLSAYRGSMANAKATVCTSNLHQIQLAMSMYRDDTGAYPPDSSTWPGFLPYFRGTVPECPLATKNSAGRVESYFLQGDLTISRMQKNEANLECQRSRGASFPVAYDSNHASTLNAYKAGQRFYLFVREDGSLGRRDGGFLANYLNESHPCPLASQFLNL